jgi:hypothetical protein
MVYSYTVYPQIGSIVNGRISERVGKDFILYASSASTFIGFVFALLSQYTESDGTAFGNNHIVSSQFEL